MCNWRKKHWSHSIWYRLKFFNFSDVINKYYHLLFIVYLINLHLDVSFTRSLSFEYIVSAHVLQEVFRFQKFPQTFGLFLGWWRKWCLLLFLVIILLDEKKLLKYFRNFWNRRLRVILLFRFLFTFWEQQFGFIVGIGNFLVQVVIHENDTWRDDWQSFYKTFIHRLLFLMVQVMNDLKLALNCRGDLVWYHDLH